MKKAKGIVQSGGKVVAMLLLCCCVVAGSGCAPLLEWTKSPVDGTESKQVYNKPPDEAWVMQPATQVREEYGPDGKVVAMTRTEYAMPSSLASNTFRGSSEFVEADRSYRFDSNPDGQGVEFAATTVINEGAYQAGTTAQVARTEVAVAGLTQAVAGLVEVAKVALPKYFDLLTTQANNDAILRQRELELKEKEIEIMALHGGEHAAPAEPAATGGE